MLKTGNISSYPPLFRPTRVPDPTHEPTGQPKPESYDHPDDPLPVVDMQHLDAEILDKACREWGLFRVINHGVPRQLTEELMRCAKKLFDLSFETKQGLSRADGTATCGSSSSITNPSAGNKPVYFWGTPALTTSGVAIPRGPRRVDRVEGFNAAIGQLRQVQTSAISNSTNEGEDDLPSIISDFRNLLKEYGEHTTSLAKSLFEAMARNLKLDKQQLGDSADGDQGNCTGCYDKYLDESTGSLRVYRYPPSTDLDQQVKGLDDHTDSSLISILNQDEVGGLEFLKGDEGDEDHHDWIHVKPVPDTLVVNLGDMMQAISGDQYKSVRHSVRLNRHRERFSTCYFVFPEENTCIRSSNDKYRPFTYNEFRSLVQRDVATFGWKLQGLQHFRNYV